MLIDAHTHLGRKGGALEARAEALIKSMDEAHIDEALVFAGRINGITTEEVIDEIASHSRLYAIASASMGEGGESLRSLETLHSLEEYLKHGVVRGLKFYPGYEYYYPADEWLREFLDLLVKYDRPAIFHAGDTFSKVHQSKLKYALPIHIDDLATEMPQLKIVIAHLGYPWQRDAAEVVYKNKNVYSDCSGFVYGEFNEQQVADFKIVWEEFTRVACGHEKVLFGTDFPISSQKSYAETVGKIIGYGEAVNHIYHGNAQRLFGL